jgi:hypothetical protein
MTHIAALAIAAALLSIPVVAHAQGKSNTAPGRSTTNPSPGHTDTPKENAPGHLKLPGDSAKKFAPGREQSTTPNPNAPSPKK